MAIYITEPRFIYHPEYAGDDGRFITPENNGGETFESLAARGWVDHLWKLKDGNYEKVKSGEIPAFKALGRQSIESEQKKLEKLKAEVAKAKAEAEALKSRDEAIRTKETVAERKKLQDEEAMDEFQDSGALQNEFLQKNARKRASDIKEADKAKRHPKTKKTSVAVPEGVSIN